ncbi:Dehydrogenase, multihelical [Syntrophomonas zehnderi OL-4]|uniref:Dehydrogenase, multihelical n=1 Tax=Syntrophomonas zehnderi OL-4 TaxID=690567 RepID=A0A0E4CKP9_9FIRM|nr:3-hydroxyacyl-CoA dehydrogenase NAD-binding domain-containing protein [Syntrophomonas zehnderi]CQB51956.1 Dehydrogenase, multihelical [Syntrophomonas zehnderi OL-4]
MKKRIRKVAIIGSGTMGGGIAALLAGAGIRSYLLDIVPKELTDKEKAAGLTTDSPAFRNRIAESNKALLLKSRPAQFMQKADADLVTCGNTEDHIGVLAECDWVVEVVPEVIEIKKAVLKNIAANIKPGTFVTSNTSSISINKIVEDMPLEFRQYWMGTHFFNPVRYMKLLELIPGKDTLPEVVEFFADFGERVLGKGIVYAKDTPAFVANRLGNWAGPSVTQLMMELGLTVPEVDALTGSAIGRPGTGTFGLFDMVGVDIAVLSTLEVQHNVDSPEEKAMYTPAPFLQKMLDNNMLGAKTKGGFYKRVGKEKQVLDVNTFEYGPIVKPDLPSLAAAKAAKSVPEKVTAFFESDDKGGQFIWKHVAGLFLYAASKIPEVSDDVLNMDRALNWGYNHQMGPFQLFSALDLPKYIARMKAEGMSVPAWIDEMLAAGITSFYKTEAGVDYYYSIPDKKYVEIAVSPSAIILPRLKAQNKIVSSTASGTLYDLGDGVLGLDTHSMANCVTVDLWDTIAAAQAELEKPAWEGMVISGAGKDFMGNATDFFTMMNLANEKKFDDIDAILKKGQSVLKANKYNLKPVVVAAKGKCLAAGCDLITQCSAAQVSGETYAGHVEIGFGLIPAFGGVKESVLRVVDRISKGDNPFPVNFVQPEFEAIAQAKVGTSAKEVMKLSYLRPTDGISLNEDFLLTDAKKRVLDMVNAGYSAPVSRPFKAFGQTAVDLLVVGTKGMMWAGVISEYDWEILCSIINIYAGGGVSTGMEITEDYLLELEREAFLKLIGNQKTLDRILSMVTKGKPLRN